MHQKSIFHSFNHIPSYSASQCQLTSAEVPSAQNRTAAFQNENRAPLPGLELQRTQLNCAIHGIPLKAKPRMISVLQTIACFK
jgi:hypothetical protein